MNKIKAIIGAILYTVFLGIVPALIWAGTSAEPVTLFAYFGLLVGFSFGFLIFANLLNDKQHKKELEDLSMQITALSFSVSELKKQVKIPEQPAQDTPVQAKDVPKAKPREKAVEKKNENKSGEIPQI